MSVGKMKDGKRWYASVRVEDWTGKVRQHKKEGFARRSDALEWQTEFTAKHTGATDMTVQSLYELYIEDFRARFKPTTAANKECLFESHVLPHLGRKKAGAVKPADIRKWQATLMSSTQKDGKPYSQTYLKAINNQVSALFNYGVKFYGLKNNPCRTAGSMGKKRAESMQFWTVEEFNKFIEAVSDNPASLVIFNLLFWTGMREGELLALTPEDFDFEKPSVRINKNYARQDGEDLIMPPKTPKSNREILITPQLASMVKRYITMLPGVTRTDRIFSLQTKAYLHREMDRGCAASGVKRIRIHDLRHSHASLLIELGYSPLLIAERLGHENIETTLQTYSHLYPNKQGELVEKLKTLETCYEFVTQDSNVTK